MSLYSDISLRVVIIAHAMLKGILFCRYDMSFLIESRFLIHDRHILCSTLSQAYTTFAGVHVRRFNVGIRNARSMGLEVNGK